MLKPNPSGACRVCAHPERKTIEQALRIGQAPRSIVRRSASLSRKAVAQHRDECLQSQVA
jgi:hypothetical protein